MSAARGSRGAVVVGVDGSANAGNALRFALQEGVRRGAPVRVVTAWMTPSAPALSGVPLGVPEQAREAAAQMQATAVDEALALATDDEVPEIVRELAFGYGAEVLLDAARDAAVLVVGHTPRHWPARAVLGSVSEQCVRRSTVPVIVVPPPAQLPADAVTDDEHGLVRHRHPHVPALAPGVF